MQAVCPHTHTHSDARTCIHTSRRMSVHVYNSPATRAHIPYTTRIHTHVQRSRAGPRSHVHTRPCTPRISACTCHAEECDAHSRHAARQRLVHARGSAVSRARTPLRGRGGGLPRMWAVATRGRLWAWAVETRGRADGDGADRAPLSRAFSPPKVTPATRAALATAAEATVCTADQRHQTAARDHSLGF